MKLRVLSIAKPEKSLYSPLYKELEMMTSKFTKIEDIEIFNKKIHQAQVEGEAKAQASYTQVYEPYLSKSYNIALHPNGKLVDSFKFAKLLSDKISVNFYIGGAYGFEDSFLKQCDAVISLGELTMSHKIAKAVLMEQIFRGFAINNNHPYHK
ncbi:MAG TPA: 23S rRNA (pseudouridine(1915)-N(3))-methyltransferase RlmH [Sulfurimonas sp.]|nr:23S rRNA (pseudouridine(1915)-N(3))-methyltransferase RlmH [Sulfurimonas sp.]